VLRPHLSPGARRSEESSDELPPESTDASPAPQSWA